MFYFAYHELRAHLGENYKVILGKHDVFKDDYDNKSWISYEMVEAYGIGVISTVIILMFGMMIFYVCSNQMHGEGKVKYAKVVTIDSTDDERIVINQ